MQNSHSNSILDKEVHSFLRKKYKEYKKTLTFPTQTSALQKLYETKLYNEIRTELYKKFPLLRRWTIPELKSLLNCQILNALVLLNFYRLRKFINRIIEKFLNKLDLRGEFEVEAIQVLLKDNIDHNDKIILEMFDCINNPNNIDKKMTFMVLSTRVQELHSMLIVYQKLLYSKYEMSEFYFDNRDKINQEIVNWILYHSRDKYSDILKKVDKSLQKLCNECYKEFETNFKQNLADIYTKKSYVATYIDAYKSTRKYLVNIFNEHVKNEYGDLPSEIFLSGYVREIEDKVFASIIENNLNNQFNENNILYKDPMFEKISMAFESCSYDHSNGNSVLFEELRFRTKENLSILFSIIILTDYSNQPDQDYLIYFPYLEAFYKVFISQFEKVYPQLQNYFLLIDTKEKYLKNQSAIQHQLEIEREKWELAVDSFENLYSMACVFLAFNKISIEDSQRKYNSIRRTMLQHIFRNLKNGQSQFTNFQLLSIMETFISNYNKPTDETETETETAIEDIEKENILITEYQICLDQLVIDTKKPEKFVLEKISDPFISSKTIIICIGDYCLGDKHSKDWEDVANRYPSTEVLTLKWDSNATKNIFQLFLKEFTEFSNASQGIILGIALPPLTPFLIGYATFKAVKDLKNDIWDRTYEEACCTGIYLAHILNQVYNSKDMVVNLIGFGQGSLVAMSCVWELERINRHDLIYDVLLLGGVANLADFYKSPLNAIGHRLINCYSQKDFVLKYWLKTISYSLKPIGAEPIFCSNNKIKNVDITKEVKGHLEYKENMAKILFKSDFNEDLNYLMM